jgi:hypothetical protein
VFHDRATVLVEECTPGDRRLGGAKAAVVTAVEDGLRGGLTERVLLDLIEKWLGVPHASSSTLHKLVHNRLALPLDVSEDEL